MVTTGVKLPKPWLHLICQCLYSIEKEPKSIVVLFIKDVKPYKNKYFRGQDHEPHYIGQTVS